LYYYVKILKNMFILRPAENNSSRIGFGWGYNVLLLVLAVPTIILGVYFAPLTKFAEYSIQIFGLK
jgi:NADH:ubiquinone oxidoreductase subunit 2 (subunit N)